MSEQTFDTEHSDDARLPSLRLVCTIGDAARIEVMRQIDEEGSWHVERDLNDLRRPLKSLDPTILPIVNICIAIAALGYTVWKDRKKGITWTEEKLRDHLATELTAKGIVGFEIVEVNNFDAFRKGEELCVIRGYANDDRAYKVWLLLDGEVAVLQIADDSTE